MFRRNDVVGANRHASRTVFWSPFNFLELRNAEALDDEAFLPVQCEVGVPGTVKEVKQNHSTYPAPSPPCLAATSTQN